MPQQTRCEEGLGGGLGGGIKHSSVALAVNDDLTVPFNVVLSAFTEDANMKTDAIKVAKISLFIASSLIIRLRQDTLQLAAERISLRQGLRRNFAQDTPQLPAGSFIPLCYAPPPLVVESMALSPLLKHF